MFGRVAGESKFYLKEPHDCRNNDDTRVQMFVYDEETQHLTPAVSTVEEG